MRLRNWTMTAAVGVAMTVTSAPAYGFFPPLPVGQEPVLAPVTVSQPPAAAPVVIVPLSPMPVVIPANVQIPPVPPPPFVPPVPAVPIGVPDVDCAPNPHGVPEPATILSGLLGLAAVGAARRLRRGK